MPPGAHTPAAGPGDAPQGQDYAVFDARCAILDSEMENFIVVRYLHKTGMPAAGTSLTDKGEAVRAALNLSKEHPGDWVFVESGQGGIVGRFFRGSEVTPYMPGETSRIVS